MINEKQLTKLSKFMSLVLRHAPETIGLTLDDNGWASVPALIDKMKQHGRHIDREMLEHIVATNNKKRFAFNHDGERIRASQGHSISVDLGYTAQQPPEKLYHGTSQKSTEMIFRTGIQKMKRHHVHLSADKMTAKTVGARHGKPVILTIDSQAMADENYTFFRTDNGVWLVEAIPVRFICARE